MEPQMEQQVALEEEVPPEEVGENMESEHEDLTQVAPEEVVPPAPPAVRIPNVGGLLANIRRKKSERIVEQKLAKRVRGKNGEGSSVQKPQVVE
ncbi:hypothetical protein LXL04_035993 [Taraxacum kok-saghyz]